MHDGGGVHNFRERALRRLLELCNPELQHVAVFLYCPPHSVIGTGLRLRLNLDQDTQLDSCTHRKLLDDFVDDVSKLLRGSILMGEAAVTQRSARSV